MVKKFPRRQALRLGVAGLFTAPFATRQAMALGTQRSLAQAGMVAASPKRLLVVFLRGGCDTLNMVMPNGSPALYSDYQALRPTIHIPDTQSLDLNGFAHLHPSLQPLMTPYANDDLAVIHRVSHQNATKSHFTEQQSIETAEPGNNQAKEGFVPRLIQQGQLSGPQSTFAGASVSPSMQQLFFSDDPTRVLAHIPRIPVAGNGKAYSLSDLPGMATPKESKLEAALQASYANPLQGGSYDPLARGAGLVMVDSQAAVSSFTDPGTFPADNFGRQVRDASFLLTATDCVIAGVQLGGFDTHAAQGSTTGNQANQFARLAAGLRAFYDATINHPTYDVLTLVVTEFGRRNFENGGNGTDHGRAHAMLAMGSSVKGAQTGTNGGIYNMDAASWQSGAGGILDAAANPDLPMTSDYREVLAQAMRSHLQVAPGNIDNIIPNYNTLQATAPGFATVPYV